MKNATNKNTKGKLYAKYYNSMRQLKTTGLIPKNLSSKVLDKIPTGRKYDVEFGKLKN